MIFLFNEHFYCAFSVLRPISFCAKQRMGWDFGKSIFSPLIKVCTQNNLEGRIHTLVINFCAQNHFIVKIFYASLLSL